MILSRNACKRTAAVLFAAALGASFCACAGGENTAGADSIASSEPVLTGEEESGASVTQGTESYRGFLLDNVLHSEDDGDIHYSVYIPDSYDGSRPYALFVTLPGYEGLYFQGVGQNLYSEEFAFTAQSYISDMIIVAPQLNDWGDTSAEQAIALTEYFLSHYNIDSERVYAEGYSGGGETLSLVLEKRPELFAAGLLCSSQWDGEFEPLVRSRTPVYQSYRDEGLSEEEIDGLLVLDVKAAEYFTDRGITVQHGGGGLFAQDEEIMGWLFGR